MQRKSWASAECPMARSVDVIGDWSSDVCSSDLTRGAALTSPMKSLSGRVSVWRLLGPILGAATKANIREAKFSAAGGAHCELLQFAAVDSVEHADWRRRGPEQPSVAPLAQRDDGRQEIFPHLAQDILVPPGFVGDGLALEDSASDQLLQSRGQQIARDFELLLKIIESGRA